MTKLLNGEQGRDQREREKKMYWSHTTIDGQLMSVFGYCHTEG